MGTGLVMVAACPRTSTPTFYYDVCELSDLAAKNSWPIEGGTLDQSDTFHAAHQIVQSATYRLLKPKKK